jgi:hypothetical protein
MNHCTTFVCPGHHDLHYHDHQMEDHSVLHDVVLKDDCSVDVVLDLELW